MNFCILSVLNNFSLQMGLSKQNRKGAIFLTVVSPSTYALIQNFLSPVAPNTKTLEEIISVLNSHFDPAPFVIVEIYKFNSRVYYTSKSFATFIVELRSLAKRCSYGTSLDEMLNDRTLCGIKDEAIQRKLLMENPLTLTRATEIVVAMEIVARDAK